MCDEILLAARNRPLLSVSSRLHFTNLFLENGCSQNISVRDEKLYFEVGMFVTLLLIAPDKEVVAN